MADSRTGRERFVLTLEALPDDVASPEIRLRRLLKHTLRTLGFRCVAVEEMKAEPEGRSGRSFNPGHARRSSDQRGGNRPVTRTAVAADPLRCRSALAEHRRRAKADHQLLDYTAADLERLARSATTCAYCRAPLLPELVTFDHVRPTCRVADYRLANLAAVCMPCQLAKGLLSGEEFLQLLGLLKSWHPRAGNDLLARLRAGGRRYSRGRRAGGAQDQVS